MYLYLCLGDDDMGGPQTRNRNKRRSSVNGNNNMNNNARNDGNNTATGGGRANATTTNTNTNTKPTKNWNLARKNIRKSGSFHDNCPRHPEALLLCVERRIRRPSSTTMSELSYSSEVVVYRNGNVAQLLFNIGERSIMKNAFTADVSILTK